MVYPLQAGVAVALSSPPDKPVVPAAVVAAVMALTKLVEMALLGKGIKAEMALLVKAIKIAEVAAEKMLPGEKLVLGKVLPMELQERFVPVAAAAQVHLVVVLAEQVEEVIREILVTKHQDNRVQTATVAVAAAHAVHRVLAMLMVVPEVVVS